LSLSGCRKRTPKSIPPQHMYLPNLPHSVDNGKEGQNLFAVQISIRYLSLHWDITIFG